MAADRLTEHWDIYNRQLQVVGHRQRKETLHPGEYHLVVNAFIFHPDGQVLLQQRTADKLNFPSCWDCSVGGSVLAGETIETGMHREMHEELGLDLPVTAANNYWLRPYSHWIEAWFAFETTTPLDNLTLQRSEVQRAAFFSPTVAHNHLEQIGFNAYSLELRRAWEHLSQK